MFADLRGVLSSTFIVNVICACSALLVTRARSWRNGREWAALMSLWRPRLASALFEIVWAACSLELSRVVSSPVALQVNRTPKKALANGRRLFFGPLWNICWTTWAPLWVLSIGVLSRLTTRVKLVQISCCSNFHLFKLNFTISRARSKLTENKWSN